VNEVLTVGCIRRYGVSRRRVQIFSGRSWSKWRYPLFASDMAVWGEVQR